MKQLLSAAESLSGHRGALPSSAGLISSSLPCFAPPLSRLLLLSSGCGAKRLAANREGLPWETEKGERGVTYNDLGSIIIYLWINDTEINSI